MIKTKRDCLCVLLLRVRKLVADRSFLHADLGISRGKQTPLKERPPLFPAAG